MTSLHAVRVFDPRVGTRDGLEFTASIDKKDRKGFITGTALAILHKRFNVPIEDVFNACSSDIAVIVGRKYASLADDTDIFLDSSDVE